MKTLLICHEEADLDKVGLARWLASFSELVGIVVLRETRQRKWKRIRREVRRVGILRFIDVIAFRVYHRLFLALPERHWKAAELRRMCEHYSEVDRSIQILHTDSPNSHEAQEFIRRAHPDVVVARCKTLLTEQVLSLPTTGTFVMHPGICPEYRNAHGCFWALVNDDLHNVGMTLLKIDRGVDTGPVYGYYSYDYDEVRESPFVIQERVVLENLLFLEKKLRQVFDGLGSEIDTFGRQSRTWGQPWLSRYLVWKRRARRRASTATSLLYHDVVQPGMYASSGFQGGDADRYKLDVREFGQHLVAIEEADLRPVSILGFLEGARIPSSFFMTFDDGGVSAYDEVATLLDERRWPGHFLITTDYIGRAGFLSKEQIRDLRRRGHVIGSHSCSHPSRMSQCSWRQLVDEWNKSIATLSDILGEPVVVASVPGGYYSRAVAEAAAKCGAKALFTSEPIIRHQRVDGCFVFGRYTLFQGDTAGVALAFASGLGSARFRQMASWKMKKIAKAIGGEHYVSIRKRILSKTKTYDPGD